MCDCKKHTVNLSVVDGRNDNLGSLAVDTASDTVSSAENLLNTTSKILGERLEAHRAGDFDDLVKGDRLVVLDVLLLLAITRRLLESLDDQGRGGGNHRHGGLTVLDGELDSYAQALPVTSSLGDVFTDLLGRQTQRTDLGSEGGRGTNFTTGGAKVDDLHLIGIELGSCTALLILFSLLFAIQLPKGASTYAYWRFENGAEARGLLAVWRMVEDGGGSWRLFRQEREISVCPIRLP